METKNQEKTRCFVAIDFPREIINEVKRVQKEIGKKNIFHGKFTEGENLHLSLKFLGEIDKKKIEEAKGRLSKIKFEKFEAGLGELGVFSSAFIRIVWIKIFGKGPVELQKKVDDVLKDLFEPERRFMSHLTIVRVKNVKDRKLFLDELEKVKVQKLKFEVDRFYLIKSELKPEGPEYSILGEYELRY